MQSSVPRAACPPVPLKTDTGGQAARDTHDSCLIASAALLRCLRRRLEEPVHVRGLDAQARGTAEQDQGLVVVAVEPEGVAEQEEQAVVVRVFLDGGGELGQVLVKGRDSLAVERAWVERGVRPARLPLQAALDG